jgi:hypothetical protein
MRRAAVVALLAALSASSAGAASASSYFRTPSGNIVCGAFTGPGYPALLECGVLSGLVPPPRRPSASACHGDDFASDRIHLNTTGRPYGFCSGDVGVLAEAGSAPVLGYGSSVREGPFRCTSARAGLSCRNRSAHGFFLSRQAWRAF